jgi:serine protease Do
MNHQPYRMGRIGFSIALATLILIACSAGQAPQQSSDGNVLRSLNASLEQVAAKVFPAVVHIEVVSYEPFPEHDTDTKVQILAKQHASGSGIIVDPDGYVITALHVIEGARRINVELDSHAQPLRRVNESKHHLSFEAKIVGTFKDADIAVLKIEAKDLPTVSFPNSDNLKQGELVAALGSPEGLRNSLSLGVVSAVARQIENDDSMVYVQTDAALASGCSGGPLVNIQGEMVGMDVFSITDRGRSQRLGFAIPSEVVHFVYQQIRQYGHVPRAYLGIEAQGITPTLATALHLPTDSGVVISDVADKSPAGKAVLQPGDVILSVDGTRLRDVPQLMWTLLHKRTGDQVSLEIARKSQTMKFKLSLAEMPLDSKDAHAPGDIEGILVAKLGIMVSAWKHEASEEKNKQSSSGVIVIAQLRGIDPEPELNAGDVIRSVNAIPITSVTQLRELLDGLNPGDAIALHVERKGKLMYIAFDLD